MVWWGAEGVNDVYWRRHIAVADVPFSVVVTQQREGGGGREEMGEEEGRMGEGNVEWEKWRRKEERFSKGKRAR